MGEKRKYTFGSTRRSWEDNIKRDVKELEWEGYEPDLSGCWHAVVDTALNRLVL
jgi:hypothetical protein